MLGKTLVGVPDDEIDKMTHLNAMRLFRFDPFVVRPRKKCTVGALRAEAAGVDVAIRSAGLKFEPPTEPIRITWTWRSAPRSSAASGTVGLTSVVIHDGNPTMTATEKGSSVSGAKEPADGRSRPRVVRALRPKQWLKNEVCLRRSGRRGGYP